MLSRKSFSKKYLNIFSIYRSCSEFCIEVIFSLHIVFPSLFIVSFQVFVFMAVDGKALNDKGEWKLLGSFFIHSS